MKYPFYLILSLIFIVTSCSLNDNENSIETDQVITIEWHLTKSSGGIAGEDYEFDLDTIIWDFDSQNGSLTISNNNTDDNKEDALSSGTYLYELLELNNLVYIVIDGEEYGEIIFSSNNDAITINQNHTSTGNSSDLFVYNFTRKLITTDSSGN
ncbi:hypothetical protein GCM10022291_18500 [Postechiella marina]|uniref:Lipocalin-like domain-containing protein n=1 Tax=Postechiella marina TaxID=943941 RepID=A0ABP8C9G6_9FLAO